MNMTSFLNEQKLLTLIELQNLGDILQKLFHIQYNEEIERKSGILSSIELYPNYYYNSFIIRLFSFLESSLFDLCDTLLEDKSINLKCSRDLSGSSTEKIKKCIEKIIHVNLRIELWNELDNFRVIRNSIIHSESELNEQERRKLVIYLHEHDLINDWVETVITNFKYCCHILLFCNEFIEELYTVLAKKIE